MAGKLHHPQKQNNSAQLVDPDQVEIRTVLDVKEVKLAVVSYKDDTGRLVAQLAIVGDNNVNLLESRSLGLTKETTPQGFASNWLRDGIFEKLGKSKK